MPVVQIYFSFLSITCTPIGVKLLIIREIFFELRITTVVSEVFDIPLFYYYIKNLGGVKRKKEIIFVIFWLFLEKFCFW